MNHYNLGSIAASDSLFDSRGRFSRLSYPNEDIAEIEGLRGVAMATNFTLSADGLTGDNDMML